MDGMTVIRKCWDKLGASKPSKACSLVTDAKSVRGRALKSGIPRSRARFHPIGTHVGVSQNQSSVRHLGMYFFELVQSFKSGAP